MQFRITSLHHIFRNDIWSVTIRPNVPERLRLHINQIRCVIVHKVTVLMNQRALFVNFITLNR